MVGRCRSLARIRRIRKLLRSVLSPAEPARSRPHRAWISQCQRACRWRPARRDSPERARDGAGLERSVHATLVAGGPAHARQQDHVERRLFGSKGTHLIGAYELNEIPPGVALTRQCATGTRRCKRPGRHCSMSDRRHIFRWHTGGVSSNILDQIRPYRGYRSITMITPQFNSNYHSLQVMGQRRFSGASNLMWPTPGRRT